jgi:hypothetical protein
MVAVVLAARLLAVQRLVRDSEQAIAEERVAAYRRLHTSCLTVRTRARAVQDMPDAGTYDGVCHQLLALG